MKEILIGMTRFQNEVFGTQRKQYEELATGQQPQTLFIGCSDSRLLPNDMLQAGPGELFICRNAGNIVPAHSDNLGGVAATVEYAVQVLKVKNIIVCGHSDCGAMRAVMAPEKVKHLRAVSQWILHAERVSAVARELHGSADDPDFLDRLIEENVIAQLDNLMTHPYVAAKVRSGNIALHGMVFDIRRGTFLILDQPHHKFMPMADFSERFHNEGIANASS